jgi:SAM-dependent methyltransferase
VFQPVHSAFCGARKSGSISAVEGGSHDIDFHRRRVQVVSDHLDINRAFWDELAVRHLESDFYETAAFRRGEIVLDPVVRERIGDVRGKKILHLQCHFGLDTLSLARMGAEVTGLDFSGEALRNARALAQETGIAASFVKCDVLHPPPDIEDFDVVFASWGAIVWIDDIAQWMRVAARALRPGGRLFMADGHPFMMALDEACSASAPFTVRYAYDSNEPQMMDDQVDYAEPGEPLTAHRNVQFLHGIAKILNAAIAAGFTIRKVEELDIIPWQGLPQLVKADARYWTLPTGAPFIPLALVLDATKDDNVTAATG